MPASDAPPRDRQRLRRQRTRDEIVAAAWELAEEHGIAGLSLRDLAAAVGMRAPSLYSYFDSKAAIYDAMFAAGYEQFGESLGELDVTGDAEEVLTRALTAFLEFCAESIPRYQLMFTRVVPGWEPSPEAYALSLQQYQRMTDDLAAIGIRGETAVDLWTAMSSGLAAQQVANDPEGDRWIRLARDAVRMFLHHLAHDPHREPGPDPGHDTKEPE